MFGSASITVTFIPRCVRVSAISSPMSPAPMTMACFPFWTLFSMACPCSMVRRTWIVFVLCFSDSPSIGGMVGCAPVAKISFVYGSVSVFSSVAMVIVFVE